MFGMQVRLIAGAGRGMNLRKARARSRVAGAASIFLVVLVGCSTDEPGAVPIPDTVAASTTMTASTAAASSTSGQTATAPANSVDAEPWFASNWTTNGIRLTSLDGSATRDVLTDLPGGAMLLDPDWSPDGDRIVANLVSADNTPGSILISTLDGTEQQTVETCSLPCLGYGSPSWSRDGTRIVFPRVEQSGFVIRIADTRTGSASDVLKITEAGHAVDQLRWSPAGDELVGVVQQWNLGDDTKLDSAHLAVVSLANGDVAEIDGAGEYASSPDWHPTQDLIVFATYGLSEFQQLDEQASNLFTIRSDGSELTQITNFPAGGPRATQPTWSPDGLFIVFTLVTGDGDNVRHIATIAADGTALTDLGASGTHNRLRP